MTVGIIRGVKFPKSVMQSQQGYKKKIAEEFVEVNLLTNAEAHLINGKLEDCLVQFSIGRSENIICLNAKDKYVRSFESNSSEQFKKLNVLVDFVWNNCDTIYEFVIILDSNLRSQKPVIFLKENVLNMIVDLRILMSNI